MARSRGQEELSLLLVVAYSRRIRDGKIVDMQGCATRRHAERFARRKRD
jgi:hypothetical protein